MGVQWIANNGWIWWLALAVALAAVEAVTVDLVFLMLAGGALAAALASFLGVPFALAVIVAVIAATALLGIARPPLKRRLLRVTPEIPMGADAQVGRPAIVVEPVTSLAGRVKLSGEIWSARAAVDSPELPVGREVRVVAIDGATVIVTPLVGSTPSEGE